MEALLMCMLFFRSAAILVGIFAFTLMCAIGVVIAVDEIRHKLGWPVYQIVDKRRDAKHRKIVEDEEWTKFWTDLESGFEDTGEIKAREYIHSPAMTERAWFRDTRTMTEAERIRNDFPE